jgi:hypothetical protein
MGSVVVATTRGWLRFFSTSGVQRYVWRLGEDVVSMAAGREGVCVVHREGGTSLDGESTRQRARRELTGRVPELAIHGRGPREL